MDKITWIGQAGLLFEHKGYKIMLDPYLSESVVKVNPKNYRRVEVDESLFDIKPDIMIFTHNHLDHLDVEAIDEMPRGQVFITTLEGKQKLKEMSCAAPMPWYYRIPGCLAELSLKILLTEKKMLQWRKW